MYVTMALATTTKVTFAAGRRKGYLSSSSSSSSPLLVLAAACLLTLCLQNLVYYHSRLQQHDDDDGAATKDGGRYHSLGCQLGDWPHIFSQSQTVATSTTTTDTTRETVPKIMVAATESSQQSKRLVTVFSTGCSPTQDWQSQALLYSHRQQRIPGELIRLLSCNDVDPYNYKLPKASYKNYRVVRTPDFSTWQQDDYSPRNRPAAMEYWLNGLSPDDPKPPAGNDTIILAVDPDMIFLHSDSIDTLMNMVRPGHGVATHYGIGSDWLQENKNWKKFWCSNQKNRKCHIPLPSADYNPSFGHPQLLTAEDAKRQAQIWLELTNSMRQVHQGWQTEMYSNVIAMHLANISVAVQDMMVSDPSHAAEQDAWRALRWFNPKPLHDKAPLLFAAHYCQRYQLGFFVFDKKRADLWKDIDFNNCSSPQPALPSVNDKTQDLISKLKYNQSLLQGQEEVQTQEMRVVLARNGWMIDKVYRTIQEAIGDYYEEFCTAKEESNA
jgi:hypothetical protein